MYNKDVSGMKIAKKFHCHNVTIYNILKKKGIKVKGAKYFNKKNPPKLRLIKDESRVVDMYTNQNFSGKEIAKKLCCSPNTIYRLLKRNKVILKGIKHFNKGNKKIIEARAKQILPKKDTKIEVKIQKFLKRLGIEFFTHQYMKIEHGYQCDILIPSMNMVIECDGDYWHKYPVGNEIDHIRTSELLGKGFKVLRMWECEIKKLDINKFQGILK